MKALKYPPHFEVIRKGYFELEYLTPKNGWAAATGMNAGTPKRFRSYRNAKAAAKKHGATMAVFWIGEGEREYSQLILFGDTNLLADRVSFLPDIIKTMI